MLRSLFIASLPRSLSSLVHQVCVDALDMRAVPWTTSGEILNGERLCLDAGASSQGRFVAREHDPERFAALGGYLDAVVEPHGRVYKDVVQPLRVASWLRRRDDLAVLRIKRRLDDVAFAMLERGWTYAAAAASAEGSLEDRVLRGLLRAERALDQLDAIEVDYDDLITDPQALWSALERLYPGVPLRRMPYLDADFRRRRTEVLERRRSPRQRALHERLVELAEPTARPAPRPLRPRGARPRVLLVGGGGFTGFGRVVEEIGKSLRSTVEVEQLAFEGMGSAPSRPWPVRRCAAVSGTSELLQILAHDPPDAVLFVNDLWRLDDHLAVLHSLDSRPRLVGYAPVEAGPIPAALVRNLGVLDHLVLYTEHARAEVERALPASMRPPSSVIPHGVDTTTFHPLADDPRERARRGRAGIFPRTPEFDDGFFVLNANRNQPRKCIDLTFAGFAAFAADKPANVKLVLHMGRSDLGWDLLELTRRHGLGRRVVLTSRRSLSEPITDHDLNRLYNACQVGLNTAYAEGWGLVAFEHAATGAAQVMPRLGNLAEIWQEHADLLEPRATIALPQTMYEAGIVSPHDIADTLQRLYDDPALLEQRSTAAHTRATDPAFAWPALGTHWRTLLTRLLDLDHSLPCTA